MSDEPNNPAGRLLKILEKSLQQDGSLAARHVWARTLNCRYENHLIYPNLTKVLSLVHDTRAEMLRIPIVMETLSEWTTALEISLFQMNLDNGWTQQSGFVHQALKPDSDSSNLLSHFRSERKVDTKNLDNFRSDVSTLLQDVQDSDLERELKDLLIDQLRDMLDSIDTYELKGMKGVQEAIQQTLGVIASNEEVRKKLSVSSIGQRLWQIINIYGVLLGVVLGTAQLTEMVQPALPPAKPELLAENPVSQDDSSIEIIKPEPIYKKDEDDELESPQESKN